MRLGHRGLRTRGIGSAREGCCWAARPAERAHHPSDPRPLAKALLALFLLLAATPLLAQDGGADPPVDPPAGAAPANPTPVGQAASPKATPRPTKARAFARRLAEVIAHERKVQKYERESLGAIHIGTLAGKRLEFRRRVDRDAKEFEARLAEVPSEPLELPRLTAARRPLSPREAMLVARINRAYIKDRDIRELNSIYNINEKFLATENWSAREGVVRTRDALLEREITYGDLVASGRKILTTVLTPSELDDIEAVLDEISPETKTTGDSLVRQILEDPALQAKVFAELKGVMTARYQPHIPEESDEELLAALGPLQDRLLLAADLAATKEELAAIDAELAQLNAQLEDMGVGALTADQRRATAKRKAEVSVQRNALQFKWNHTQPPAEEFSELMSTQDALIRRRLHDLGARGALFARRYDDLQPDRALARANTAEQWSFLDAQAQLITSLDRARPAPNPLAGLIFAPPRVAGQGLPKGLLGNLPKPNKRGPGKKKGKKGKPRN